MVEVSLRVRVSLQVPVPQVISRVVVRIVNVLCLYPYPVIDIVVVVHVVNVISDNVVGVVDDEGLHCRVLTAVEVKVPLVVLSSS